MSQFSTSETHLAAMPIVCDYTTYTRMGMAVPGRVHGGVILIEAETDIGAQNNNIIAPLHIWRSRA